MTCEDEVPESDDPDRLTPEEEEFPAMAPEGEVEFTDAQYESGGWQYAQWMMTHTFGRDRIATHQYVAPDDVRGPGLGKHDPGRGFRMQRLQQSISNHLAAAGYIG